MKYELLIKEGAQADITEGFQQYSKICPKLGDDFLRFPPFLIENRSKGCFYLLLKSPVDFVRP